MLTVHCSETGGQAGGRPRARQRASMQCVSVIPCLRHVDLPSVPAQACPELQQLALNFLATICSRHPPKHRLSFSATVHEIHRYVGPLRITLSTPTYSDLLIRQCIRPFTTNKVLSGPPLHRDSALYPPWVPGRGVLGGLRRLCLPSLPLQ